MVFVVGGSLIAVGLLVAWGGLSGRLAYMLAAVFGGTVPPLPTRGTPPPVAVTPEPKATPKPSTPELLPGVEAPPWLDPFNVLPSGAPFGELAPPA